MFDIDDNRLFDSFESIKRNDEENKKEIESIAISKYYNIPLSIAKARRDFMDEKEIEEIMFWYISSF